MTSTLRPVVTLSSDWHHIYEVDDPKTMPASKAIYVVNKCMEYACLSSSPMDGEQLRDKAVDCLLLMIPNSPERDFRLYPYEDLKKLFYYAWKKMWENK